MVRPRSVVSGQFTERINRYVSFPEFLMISVDLKPGALHRLTNIPFHEFTNKFIDAETVFPSTLSRLNDRLSGQNNYEEMILTIEQFFLDLVTRSKKEIIVLDQLFLQIIKDPSGLKLDMLAKQAYLSPRQLERKFEERIGVSPKTFQRVARFNLSYWMRLQNPHLDLFTIAIYCGYNDYQHMSKDFKEFASSSPNKFFAEESLAPGRKLGLTK
jgi:AraC-like DNA-binding protein